jgi:hypothetical protein
MDQTIQDCGSDGIVYNIDMTSNLRGSDGIVYNIDMISNLPGSDNTRLWIRRYSLQYRHDK